MDNFCKKCGKPNKFGNFCKDCLMTPAEKMPVNEIPESRLTGLLRLITVICWIGAIGGVGVGFIILLYGFDRSQNGMQEINFMVLACVSAILPYCFARAVSEIIQQLIKK